MYKLNMTFLSSRFSLIIFAFPFSFFLSCTAQQSAPPKKIKFDRSRFYQLTHAKTSIDELFDGSTSSFIRPFKNSLLQEVEVYYPVLDGETMLIDEIRMFDGIGSSAKPFTVSFIDRNWKRKKIAEFYGSNFNTWVGPDPLKSDVFKLNVTLSDIRYLIFTKSDGYPTEIEFYGKYTHKQLNTAYVFPKSKLKHYFGVNAFEWDFIDAKKNTYYPDTGRINAISCFGGIRHYLDWDRIEEKAGEYTFNPCHNGGWNYDAIYKNVNEKKLDLLVCLKTLPKWLMATYPKDIRDNENVPAPFGKNLNEPASYIEQAKAAFQLAARYGRNKNIDPALVKVNTTPRWANDRVNKKEVGLDLLHYIECDNERDKWWKGRKAYQTGREYAANLSAFYDGHKQSLGKDVGVKTADSTMKVVMGGLADPSTDYVRGMIDWCKEYRGLRKDGSVDICWDIINFHYYTNEESLKRGVPPESESNGNHADSIAISFMQLSSFIGRSIPVWVTEAGYDHHPESPNKAISVGVKNNFETQADWILRTSLLYARAGVEKVFFYQLRDDNSAYGGIYASSGLLNSDFTNRPVTDYIQQTKNLFGEFMFVKNLKQRPVVDLYKGPNKEQLYIAYLPSDKGDEEYLELSIPGVKSATTYTPIKGEATMRSQTIIPSSNKIVVRISETPTFILVR